MSGRILVATRKGLFTVERNGSSWGITGKEFLADNVSMAMTDPRDGTQYAALDHGHFGVKLHRKARGGDWEEIAVPAYPERPEGIDDNDMWGKPIPWTTVRIWALEPGGTDEPGVLWCGTIPGGLFRSPDRGSSWQLMRSLWDHRQQQKWFGGGADLPGIHSVCVDPRNSNCIRVGVSCGGMWMSEDGGETWACRAQGMRAAFMPPEKQFDPNVQDPHRITQCRASPDALWAQHHNGIFRTVDGGKTWTEVTDVPLSTFGFAVSVHPADPDTAWFVPGISDEKRIPIDGALAVTRTRDGGKSFDVLRQGLPQQHAYDIAYRHSMDIDSTGDRLAFGTTTGGLWVSEDQGDSWVCVGQHLPPVYSVRFI